MDVSYGGGCKDHEFQVIGSLAIAKSQPPIRGVQIVHQSNDDNCKAIVRKKLEVDIKDLTYMPEEGSQIYFTIDGWDGRLLYTYKEERKK